jgi:ribonuclease D
VLRRLEKLKNWRKTTAREMGVESDVVLPKVYLNALSEKPPRIMSELEIALAESPWRFRHFGPQILKMLGG